MNKILLLLMMLLSFQVYAGTTSMDAKDNKPVNKAINGYGNSTGFKGTCKCGKSY